jgi:hypothetical protein
MESKIRIKLGPIEVEYEGSEAFLKQELPALIKTVTELSKSAEVVIREEDNSSGSNAANIQLSTSTIAAKLLCSSGPDLITAAAAHLTLVKKNKTFSRQQILDEMKTATGYFKPTYRDNLSSSLQRLLKNDILNEPSTGIYSLTESERKKLESQFAK